MQSKKAKQLKGVLRNSRPTPKGRSSDKTGRIVIPSILYGAEMFDMADRDKRKLETIERQVGRCRVASLELKRWARQVWNRAEEKKTTMGKQNKALT